MRITYLHQYFNTPDMSGGTRSYEMARRLVASGHEVNLITSWRESDGRTGWFDTEVAGIRVHWLPVPYSNHMSYAQRTRAFLKFAWRSARKAASIPSDVVFATSTPLTIALPGAYAARRQRSPFVFEVRDLWPELPIAMNALRNPIGRAAARALERFAYKHADRIVTLSPGMSEGVLRTGYPSSRVSMIPNSCDLELFAPEQQAPGQFRALHPELGDAPIVAYIGTLGAINGVYYLPHIAAASLQKGIDTQFVVVGGGSEERAIRCLAKSTGVLGVNFHLYPQVPKVEIPAILADVDLALSLFVDLEAMWANSANKFFDAIASGTPIAINYRGWQADLIAGTGAGLVLPPEDAELAASAMANFLSNRDGVRMASECALRLAQSQFDRSVLANQLEEDLALAIGAFRE